MLLEHQVVHLLEHCEEAIGKPLAGVRGQLRSRSHVRSAIWELIVADALTQVGRIQYERQTVRGKTPDLFVETEIGPVWVEAAFLSPRFPDVERRQSCFRRRLLTEARRMGVSGHIGCEFYGRTVPHGYEVTLPAEHDLPVFFARQEVTAYLAFIAKNPGESLSLDLAPYGASVRLEFAAGSRNVRDSSVVVEQPRIVSEHALYRTLIKKAKRYRSAELDAPLVLCVGSERSAAVRRLLGPRSVSVDDAIRAACHEQSIISGVVVVSIEDQLSSFGVRAGRRAQVHATINHSARHPLSSRMTELLTLDFNRVDYGHSWNDWEDLQTPAERVARTGGMFVCQFTSDGYAITLPAHEVVRVLGGSLSAAELQAAYGMEDRENPLRRAAVEGRPIKAVEMLPHNPRSHEPPQLRITFGPPRLMSLQVQRR